jgi:hypothetical protein
MSDSAALLAGEVPPPVPPVGVQRAILRCDIRFARDPEAMSAALLIVDRMIAGFQIRKARYAAPPATCASDQGGLSFYPPSLPCM